MSRRLATMVLIATLAVGALAGCSGIPTAPPTVAPVAGTESQKPADPVAPQNAAASVSTSGSWTGYWTWNASSQTWDWTWVWKSASGG